MDDETEPIVPKDRFGRPLKGAKSRGQITQNKDDSLTFGDLGDTGDPAPSGDEGDIGGKKYKFSEVETSKDPLHNIKDYRSTDPGANITGIGSGPVEGDPHTSETRGLEMLLGGKQASSDISPHEYQKLTEEAHKGNKLAQQILVKGKFKAQDYPSLAQDVKKVEDPFVKALSGMPALAENLQGQMTEQTKPYDFTNAEAQVNNMLGQMGSSMQMSTSPETNSYLGKLSADVAQAGNINTPGPDGIPSIESALKGLGPAAKESEQASPYASLLAALMSHAQYQTIYGGAAPSSTGDPGWLQQLIASVTGSGIGGGLVSPSVAANALGTVPSASSSPTGSSA